MKFTILAALVALTTAQDPIELEWDAQTSCAEAACTDEGDCCGSTVASETEEGITAVEDFCAKSDTTKVSWTKDGSTAEVAFTCNAVEEGASAIKTTIAGLALDRKSTRLNSSHSQQSRMPSSA